MQTRPGPGSAYAKNLTGTDSGLGHTLPLIGAEIFLDILCPCPLHPKLQATRFSCELVLIQALHVLKI